jgi:ADP-ribose pyrophosphatase YjhB (NUDIX family)
MLIKNNCLNCGKLGHQVKSCDEPIISYGIICFNINSLLNITNKKIENFFYNKFIDINEFNYSNINNIKLLPNYHNEIKILMIRRKHSLNYIEFIRGKYFTNKDSISSLLKLMTINENIKIRTKSFDELWEEIWIKTAKNKIFQKEYSISKSKFNKLKEYNFFNLFDNNESVSSYNDPEWGFPKGRRNPNEKNFNCALREFNEETNIDVNNIHLLERLNYLEEEYNGTDNVKYKHIYYLASSENELELNTDNDNQLYEIGDIGWFTISDAISKIRPYHNTKIIILNKIYFFIINLLIDLGIEKNIINI